jgi:hypothetical protein
MRRLFIPVVASLLLVACGDLKVVIPASAKADLTCPSDTTLELLVRCIRDKMPERESEGYVAPTFAQRADWRIIVNQMMQGSCDFAVPVSLNGIVQVKTFTDTDNRRYYCLLMEVGNQNGDRFVDKGFGTFIVYNEATRQLSHQAVHPIFDRGTEEQAVTVFKATDSRSFLMAGAHRNANAAPSACLPDRRESDASHNANTMVQATNEELLAYYGAAPWFAIQWHGMADETCQGTDVYPSHGLDVEPAYTDKIMVLRDKLLLHHNNPKWRVNLPGSGSCDQTATENIQGRLLNGVAAERVCSTAASSYTQKFIHIEQHKEFRDPKDWIAPITDTFP